MTKTEERRISRRENSADGKTDVYISDVESVFLPEGISNDGREYPEADR